MLESFVIGIRNLALCYISLRIRMLADFVIFELLIFLYWTRLTILLSRGGVYVSIQKIPSFGTGLQRLETCFVVDLRSFPFGWSRA